MKYKTIAYCPVCKNPIAWANHDTPEMNGMSESLLFQPGRDEHKKESPECTKHPNWIKGWETVTKETELRKEALSLFMFIAGGTFSSMREREGDYEAIKSFVIRGPEYVTITMIETISTLREQQMSIDIKEITTNLQDNKEELIKLISFIIKDLEREYNKTKGLRRKGG